MEKIDNASEMINHKHKCRLCLAEPVDYYSKFFITDETSTIVFNLNLQVIFVC